MRTITPVGGAEGARQPISCWVLFWLFQLFFIHKKRERKRARKGAPFIKTCPGTKTPDMFFSLSLFFKNFDSRLCCFKMKNRQNRRNKKGCPLYQLPN